MPDMLVRLYALPEVESDIARLRGAGVIVRPARSYEKTRVTAWVREHFSDSWAVETEMAFCHHPVSCWIAFRDWRILGFAAYEATCRNYFGPTGVDPAARGQGYGRVLLLACLHAMRQQGYAYAIIGGVGPAEFYTRCCGATMIPDSAPGFYGDGLPAPPPPAPPAAP